MGFIFNSPLNLVAIVVTLIIGISAVDSSPKAYPHYSFSNDVVVVSNHYTLILKQEL